MRKKKYLLLALLLAMINISRAQQRVEYFLDIDPGYGKAQAIENVQVGSNQLTFDLSNAPIGAHVLYVRSQDEQGRWSTTLSRPLYIHSIQGNAQAMQRIEYFLDTDPGYGKAQTIENVQVGSNQQTFDLSYAPIGAHVLYVRSQDEQGRWSATMSRPLYIHSIQGNAQTMQRIEYFLDTDPGYGKAQAIEKVLVGSNQLTFDLSNAPAGAHVLHVRSQDEQGRWSALLSRPLYVCQMRGIAQIEYFFDNTDPGEGKAIQVPVTNPKSAEQAFAIDVNTLAEGDHTLSVRVKSFDGLWTEVSSEPFSIVKASDGIVSIIWTMPVGIHAKKGQCVVECPKDSNRGDCVVEAFDMAGHRIGTVSWPAGISSVSINTSAANAVLIKITDKLHHRQIVKRVLCQ